MPDTEIVRLLQNKDPKGLQLLLRKHASRTRWQLRNEFSSVLNLEDLDAVLNEAAHKAWESAATYQAEKGRLGAWFFVIARNLARAELRKQKHRPLQIDGLDLSGVAHEQGGALGHSASVGSEGAKPGEPNRISRSLRTCIERLPPQQRRIIEADLLTGDVADAAQLAKELDTTTNSIYVSRSNARKALKKGLKQMGVFNEGESEAAG